MSWLRRLDDRLGDWIGRPNLVEQRVEEIMEARDAPPIYPSTITRRSYGVPDTNAPSIRRQREAYRSTIYTATNMRANAISAAAGKLKVERQVASGKYEEVELSPREPWTTLLQRPSRTHPRNRMWKWASGYRDLSGRARWIIERDTRDVPLYLHPVYAKFGYLLPVPNDAGEIVSYMFWGLNGRDPYDARDVLEWTHPDLHTPFEAMSLIEAAAFEIDRELARNVYRKDNIEKGGYPDVYLSSDQELTDTQVRRYQREMRKYRGKNAATSMPVLGKGAELKGLTVSARDLQFIEEAELTHDQILELFGVIPGMLDPGANRANSRQAIRTFYEITVQPAVDDLAEVLSHQFERAFGSKPGALRVTAPNVIPTDLEEMSRIWERLVRGSIMTPNEARAESGRQPNDFGDKLMAPSFVVALEDVVSGRTVQVKDEKDEEEEPERGFGPIESRSVTALWTRNDKKKQRHSNRIAGVAVSLFQEQKQEVLDAIENGRSWEVRQDDDEPHIEVSQIFDVNRWVARSRQLFGPAIANALEAGFRNAIGLLGEEVDFTSQDEGVLRKIREINAKSKEIVETTSAQLAEEVQAGLEAGETRDQISKRLSDKFDFISAERAPVIGWTMSTGGFEGGQLIAFEKAEVDKKSWATQRDDRVRDSHVKMHGQTVAVNKPFLVGAGKHKMQHPGDPAGPASETVRCRCSMLPVIE